MDLSETELRGIREWAGETDAVQEVWLFGSRAKGSARQDSDIDLAIELRPPEDNHDWARGDYERFGDEWQRKLAEITGRDVSLELMDRILLWRREPSA
jgi:predicted nucleotidyltransferase